MTNIRKNKSLSIIKSYYESFNREDIHRLLDLLDENVVHEINQGATEVGKTLFSQFMASMTDHYRERVKDLVIMSTDDGTTVAATFIIEGTYLKTAMALPEANGQTYNLRCGSFFKLSNGKIRKSRK